MRSAWGQWAPYLLPRDAPFSFDYLVGAREERWWDGEAECASSFKIDNQLVFGRGEHRHVRWFLPFKNAVDVPCRAAELVDPIRPIGHQATGGGERAFV